MAAPRRRNQPAGTHDVSAPPEVEVDNAEDVWLTVPEIMAQLKIHRRTWQSWRTRNRTPKMLRLPNGEFRIHRDDYQAWLGGLEVSA
ncbi:helix-turn-helix transcriptional regulator [[Actinomadura] parvosata]|uniref:helix-turn-helix transcriptional regulator n=1 Tax=[Actinomadura] parvosata TaxID=1955412 RepID=UPI00406D3490